jgi:hypothetical protein
MAVAEIELKTVQSYKDATILRDLRDVVRVSVLGIKLTVSNYSATWRRKTRVLFQNHAQILTNLILQQSTTDVKMEPVDRLLILI